MNVTSLPRLARAGLLAAFAAAWISSCTTDRIAPGQCEFDSDCPSGQACSARTCRPVCRADADCGPGQRCVAADRPGSMACVSPPPDSPACVRDSDCRQGQACLDGLCRPQCQRDYDCQVVNPLSSCIEGACVPRCSVGYADCDRVLPNGCEVDVRSDVRNCSACGRACPAGQVCSGATCRDVCASGETNCSGSCLRTQTDVMNCGACGNACPAPMNATATCAAGACGFTCAEGFADCDMNPANGCEAALSTTDHCGACGTRCAAPTPLCTRGDGGSYACTATPCAGTVCSGACVDTQTDVMNCGACGNACPSGAGSAASCMAGRCQIACTEPARFADCDGMASTGCEAELPRDPMNCGACGARCPGGSNATGVCAEGACGLECAASYGNCDGMAANGCETDTRADATHCGRCGNACSAPSNARATCAAGACGFACNAGFADCDASAADGCEVDTTSDRANCGACGRACVAGEVCSAGACRSTCAAGETNCAGSCADLTSSVSNCGTCGRVCPAPANAAAACATGRCSFTCNAGFGDCDGNPANGCETSVLTSPTSCGRCGNACALAHATPGCDAGRCVISRCDAGFADCDGNPANGCEVDTRTSASNCGACGRACSLAHATAACAGGACAIASCASGFADCDRNPADGCEVDTRTSTAHCGGCGMACSAAGGAPTCAGGACSITCAAGRGDCNMSAADGCEVDTSTSPAHCGACGRACSLANATAGCAAGACTVAMCNAGYGNCDGNPANGCEVNVTTSVTHCGACGRACSLPNATAACSSGACAVARCNAGFADCNGNPADGCEVNVTSSPANCGRCGNACNATGGTATCASGVCGITCAAGRGDCNMSAADGCEVDTSTTVMHCGACGRACSLANATAGCAAGACTIATCNAGFADCDRNPANGCEVNLRTDNGHCGACATACPSGQVCSSGACTLVCGAGLTNCGGRCVSLATDTANCGRCGVACPARANAATTCSSGACGFTCNAGFADCNGNPADGCEVNLTNSPANCGRCGNACNATGGTATCASGVCGITCAAGRGDCNMSAADGCEVDTNTTVTSCGACGRACSLANATAGCAAGACTVAMCNAGFADCDRNPANGCEVNLLTSPSNCGACGTACSFANATAACTRGACGIASCNAGWGNCDGMLANGCETDTNTTVAHCGGCGMACSNNHGTPSCSGGSCAITCEVTGSVDGFFYYRTFFGNCDGNARTNGCETDLLTTSNCHACGAACSVPNATPACSTNSGSACYVGACNAGFADCNGAASDGCEVNTTSSAANCGRCGAACAAGQVCRASACRPGNDVCSGATPINLAAGREIWLSGSTSGTLHDLSGPCGAGGGSDVFFTFTLTQKELVYADTFGDGTTAHPTPTWDTVLFLASSCSAALGTAPAGERYCSDDASGESACSMDGNRSQVYAVLNPGTYYLVLSGYGSATGTAPIRFQHMPVGNGSARVLATTSGAPPATVSGATSGTGQIAGSCAGAGPEITYWWHTCTGDNIARYGVSISGNTCDAGTNYDTVIYFRQGDPALDACNDDEGATACPSRATASQVGTRVVPGAGVHAVTVDGYSTAGSFVLHLYQMAIIGSLDPVHGVCRDPRRRPAPPRTTASLEGRSPRGA